MKRLLRTYLNRFNYTTISHIDISLSSKCEFTNTKFASYIVDCVNKTLGKYTTKWFLEYSTLASTIDPNINKLRCVSIVNGDEKFVNSIEKYIKTIISVLSKDSEDDWWFHNPETFILPSQENKFLSLSSDLGSQSLDPNLISLISRSSEITKANEYEYVDDINSFMSLMEYDRTFEMMLQESGNIMKRYNTSSRLIEHYQHGVTLARSYYDYFIKQESENFGYYTFPILAAKSTQSLPDIYKNTFGLVEDRLQGQGHFFIYFDLKDTVKREELEGVLDVLYNEIHIIIHWLYLNYTFNIGLILQEKILRESLKSAVSAIMTRNMSHNLGSHYLHYTKTQLENLAKKGGEFGPDIRGAARVMGYMQGRMDYLATLISMDRYPYGCVNFKSQIFDELTIDDFSKRHFPHKRIKPNKLKEKIDILCQRMKALQSIQSKLSDEKGMKDMVEEEYIEFRKNIDTNLMDLHTISGDALKDENHNRTTNFLLSNLILSENFTRPSILDDNLKVANNLNKINLQVLLFENDKSEIFTGTLDKKDSEEDIKRRLSEINIAMPGGVMSCHAFFNIVENFIRNSAKYLQSDFDKDGNLTITIKITEINGYYEFTIFDNKQNANKKQFGTTKSLLDNLLDKISNLRILDDNNALDKKDKGFKEMLFSALWLRSYMYQNVTDDDSPHSYEEVLVRIQSEEDKEKRKETIKEYGFSLLAVNNWGIEDSSEHANLALRFILPKFEEIVDVKLMDNNLSVNLCTMLNCHGDVVYVDNDKFNSFVDQMNETRKENKDTYEKDMIIPRMVTAAPNSISALRAVLHKRFGDEFEKYHIIFSDESLERASDASVNERIKYARHLSTQDKMEIYTNYAYADSISGGNFTITLADVLTRWENDDFSEESDAYYQILKIKESALTRITIIDERFFKKMKEQQLETELACKNIRILNYNDSMSEKTDLADLLEGNAFNNHENQTHFLSIHLGIIEKIIKNVDMFKKIESNNEKVRLFMKMLKEHFGPKVFISIHSGRGNFSAELEDALDMYPFISMAALENTYENSKYLLSQLFYSTIYIGKGVANKHN